MLNKRTKIKEADVEKIDFDDYYDSNDPFIDDSEIRTVDAAIKTKYEGFFLFKGRGIPVVEVDGETNKDNEKVINQKSQNVPLEIDFYLYLLNNALIKKVDYKFTNNLLTQLKTCLVKYKKFRDETIVKRELERLQSKVNKTRQTNIDLIKVFDGAKNVRNKFDEVTIRKEFLEWKKEKLLTEIDKILSAIKKYKKESDHLKNRLYNKYNFRLELILKYENEISKMDSTLENETLVNSTNNILKKINQSISFKNYTISDLKQLSNQNNAKIKHYDFILRYIKFEEDSLLTKVKTLIIDNVKSKIKLTHQNKILKLVLKKKLHNSIIEKVNVRLSRINTKTY